MYFHNNNNELKNKYIILKRMQLLFCREMFI